MKKFLAGLTEVITACLADTGFLASYTESFKVFDEVIAKRGTVFVIGNGGSAAEAQHFSAELVGRYKRERQGYPSLALTTDTSALTAISNDYGYVSVFSRQLRALAKPGDVLVVLSTSGNSENCLDAIRTANELSVKTISLLGKTGGTIKDASDVSLVVPSNDTARIQEIHLHIIHEWCEFIEPKLD